MHMLLAAIHMWLAGKRECVNCYDVLPKKDLLVRRDMMPFADVFGGPDEYWCRPCQEREYPDAKFH